MFHCLRGARDIHSSLKNKACPGLCEVRVNGSALQLTGSIGYPYNFRSYLNTVLIAGMALLSQRMVVSIPCSTRNTHTQRPYGVPENMLLALVIIWVCAALYHVQAPRWAEVVPISPDWSVRLRAGESSPENRVVVSGVN